MSRSLAGQSESESGFSDRQHKGRKNSEPEHSCTVAWNYSATELVAFTGVYCVALFLLI